MSSFPTPIYRWAANARQLNFPGVKFFRPSIACGANSAGVVGYVPAAAPLFDYDGATGKCKGVLFERSCTPLNAFSGQFNNTQYLKVNVGVVKNAALGPNTLDYVDKIVENTDVGVAHLMSFYCTSALNSQHVLACVVKAAERTRFRLRLYNNGATENSVRVDFNLATKTPYNTVVEGNATLGHYGMERLYGDYFFCWISGIPDTATGAGTLAAQFVILDSNGLTNYNGVSGNGIYCAGMNVYVGSVAQSFVRTGWRTTCPAAVDVTTGTKTLTVSYDATVPGRAIPTGAAVEMTTINDDSVKLTGTVTSHVGTTLTLSITSVTGSGTKTDWSIDAGLITTRGYAMWNIPVNLLVDNAGAYQFRGDGTIVVRARTPRGASNNLKLFHLSDSSGNVVYAYRSSDRMLRFECWAGSVKQFTLPGPVVPDNTDFAIAVAFSNYNYGWSVDGGTVVTAREAINGPWDPSTTKLYYGSGVESGGVWDGWINSVEFYNTRIEDGYLPVLATY